MKPYRHLSSDERLIIDRMHQQGKSCRQIALKLKRSHTTILRELKRNADWKKGYVYSIAETRMLGRRRLKRHTLFKDQVLQRFVINRLRDKWSPDVIAAYLKKHHPKRAVSKETIYRFIYETEYGRKAKLYKLLTRCHKNRIPYGKRKKRGSKIPNRTSIHKRPKSVHKRLRIGHWEGDLILNKGGNIAVMIERKTRFIMAIKNKSKRTDEVIGALSSKLQRLPGKLKQSISFDQGAEFTQHETLKEAHGIQTYFCDPYSPWQKGAVENANGIIRRWIPKKADIIELKQQELDAIIHTINNTPRACLGYKTPHKLFSAYLN